LGLPRLLADVEQGYTASEHILGKFGFTFFKEEKISESNRVILFYELSKSEWEQRTLPLKK
jgi:RimJ/RimL family protein N-acetyltransferase